MTGDWATRWIMTAERIDVKRAREILETDKDAVYIDVRTEQEFAEGHPEGAINIPIGIPNPLMQRFDANPDFLDVVRASVPEHIPIVIGCKAGPRAEMAANLLSQSGYPKVRWILGGFHGMTDALGNILAPGWRQLGFPESRATGEGIGYSSLRKRADKT
jgi:rhodanese-related sulfurtransferase